MRHVFRSSCLVVALAISTFAENPSENSAHLRITGDDLVKHVETLASPDYEGRKAGTQGGEKAIDYVVDRFRTIGLRPRGTKSYEQPFEGQGGVDCANVIGLLDGSDDKLKHEYVVIGAHHDHLGKKKGVLFPGADDNASGVAALLEIARWMKEEGKPARSILFITFDSEESGLLGSKHFVDRPTVEREKIVAMINFDMVSRGALEHVCVCGKSESPEFAAYVEAAAPLVDLALDFSYDAKWRGSSDHGSFANVKIPWLYFGVEDHEDYHRPTDTADKISKPKLEKIARLGYLTLLAVANAPTPPAYVAPQKPAKKK